MVYNKCGQTTEDIQPTGRFLRHTDVVDVKSTRAHMHEQTFIVEGTFLLLRHLECNPIRLLLSGVLV